METFYNRKQIYMKNRKVIILHRLEQTVGNMKVMKTNMSLQ